MNINDLVEIELTYGSSDRPLWILDGQHRIHGLVKSTRQRNNPVPFVLLFGPNQMYKPQDLAEIFTHVTTGATPMKPLHGAWMEFAFDLGVYADSNYKNAMHTVIELCFPTTIDGNNANEFWNKIQFNPYLDKSAYKAFQFDMSEWVNLISKNYYGKGGLWRPANLAVQIIRAIRTFEKLDNNVNLAPPNNSRVFGENMGDTQYHKILAEAFVRALLSFLAGSSRKRGMAEWEQFLRHADRQFDNCNWSFSSLYARGNGTIGLSSTAGTRSKTIAIQVMNLIFENPTLLNSLKPTEFLSGLGAEIEIQGFQETHPGSGKKSRTDIFKTVEGLSGGSGTRPINLSLNGIKRIFLKIVPSSQNCLIEQIQSKTVSTGLQPLPVRSGSSQLINLEKSGYASGDQIELHITHQCYSAASRDTTRFIVNF